MRAAKIGIVLLVLSSLLMCSFVMGIAVTGLALRPSTTSALARVLPVTDGSQPAGTEDRFKVFWEAWRLAKDNYVDEKAADDQKMTYGAIQGMLDSFGDQGHTRFLSPQEAERQTQWMQSSFTGIGAEVTRRDNRPVIVTPIEGTPAEKAGIKPGDVVMKVDGVDTVDLSLDETITKIRGPEGSSVTLTIYRPSTNETLDKTITRAKIQEKIVTWAMVPGTTVAHVRLNKFSQGATKELQTALDAAKKAGATALIFDLRSNPGGLLNEAISVTSQFLPSGTVLLKQRERGGKTIEYQAQRGGVALDIPMAVLINQGSASSAEIAAGAFQFHNRAKLVGETTFGTGTILSTFKLSDGSELVLGTAEWLTPGDRMIRRQGIDPDVKQELGPDAQVVTPSTLKTMTEQQVQNANDLQFQEALKLVR